ncbi:S1 family peptidase, partial [Streptomyces sp. NPDC005918]
MRRKTRTSLGLSALLVAAACVGTGFTPAAASPAPVPGAKAQPPAASAQLQAMQRDLGLTPGAARDRLAGERKATKTERAARKAAGAAYAGSWYEA